MHITVISFKNFKKWYNALGTNTFPESPLIFTTRVHYCFYELRIFRHKEIFAVSLLIQMGLQRILF